MQVIINYTLLTKGVHEMPLLDNEMSLVGTSGYKFSATSLDDLGASEYTLVGAVVDASGSVSPFVKEMEKCLQEILVASQSSPRSENLMLRLTQFDTKVQELHGFRLLSTIGADEYDGIINIGGMTALYDSVYTMVESVGLYGKTLSEQDYDVNGIVFVITDGEDNMSKFNPARIKQLREDIMKQEQLESLLVVLIGVGNDITTAYLDRLKTEAGLDQALNAGDANPKTLARLAQFVSQSISSQSASLGSGGPSKSLVF